MVSSLDRSDAGPDDVLDRFRLDGQTAIVTGASSGIGASIATVFAELGARVFAVARRAERLSALASAYPAIQPWQTDLADEVQCERVVDGILERAGRIDILVNNAGMANIVRAQDETTEGFRRLVDVNLVATFILARDAGKAMIAQGAGGSIVNIASVTGMVGIGRPLPQAGYAASKAGCINLTRELAAQWARYRIRVNAIAPGWVTTEMTEEWLRTDTGQASVRRNTPLGRAATADEVACAALFLACRGSSYVTGAVLPVDGGWTAL
jgi:NAD(P)-dependent dehydrogenase (short-subunit alcohol dehydrogenase family)